MLNSRLFTRSEKGCILTSAGENLLVYGEQLECTFSTVTANFRSSTVVAQMLAVAAGAGIGVIPCFMARKVPDLVLILPHIHVEKSYWLQVNPDSQELARVRATIDFIVEQTRENQLVFKTMGGNDNCSQ